MPVFASPLPAIRPITDLRTKFNEVCEQATETQEPIVLTKNGTAAFVLMESKAYDMAEQRMRAAMALREAEIEEKYQPKALSSKESDKRMAEIFARWGIEYA